jgi:hypothetical protein
MTTESNNLRAVPDKLAMAAAGFAQKKRTRQVPRTMEEIKARAILEAVAAFGNHRRNAAKRLGISEATLYRCLRELKGDSPKKTTAKANPKRVPWLEFYQKLAARGFTDEPGGSEYRRRTADLIAQKLITDEQGNDVAGYPDPDDHAIPVGDFEKLEATFNSKLFITRGSARRQLAEHLDEFADVLR